MSLCLKHEQISKPFELSIYFSELFGSCLLFVLWSVSLKTRLIYRYLRSKMTEGLFAFILSGYRQLFQPVIKQVVDFYQPTCIVLQVRWRSVSQWCGGGVVAHLCGLSAVWSRFSGLWSVRMLQSQHTRTWVKTTFPKLHSILKYQ